jgi:PAS domain S-box-containing protein
MFKKNSRMSAVAQNVILGSITGIIVAYNLRLYFMKVGGTDVVWMLFFILGPAIGYLSGIERQRVRVLRREKTDLEDNLSKINQALKQSNKKYELLVEYANDAIFLTTVEGRFLIFNEATSLLSGYRRAELKNMKVTQLLDTISQEEHHNKAWLDNGICRYEEKWRTKTGDTISLEVNARYIQFQGTQLILYIARDNKRQKESRQEEIAKELVQLKEQLLVESESVHQVCFSHVMKPMQKTVRGLNLLADNYPNIKIQLSKLLSEWEKTGKYLKDINQKITRDLLPSLSRWDLNEILNQEIQYLETQSRYQGFVKQISFGSNLPELSGLGRNYSLIFNPLLKAVFESLADSTRKEFSISTRLVDGEYLVEIQTKWALSFKEHLCQIVDFSFKEKDLWDSDKLGMGFKLSELYFESLGVTLELGEHA